MYPNSLLRLLAVAVVALPPPYLLLKSSLIRSRKAIGICLPTDSTLQKNPLIMKHVQQKEGKQYRRSNEPKKVHVDEQIKIINFKIRG
jgi:hypothetical protein